MHPIHDQIGKARLADWRAQTKRDALVRDARRARRLQRPPSATRRLLSGQLQSWWETLGRLADPSRRRPAGTTPRNEGVSCPSPAARTR